jgi:hypothetical protein
VAATDFHSQDAIDRLVRRELAREAVTMALYVALTLLAALVAIPSDDVPGTLGTAALLWGGAAGLALAHWVAFDVAARLYRTAHLDRLHKLGGPVALVAALTVALVTSVPLLVAPDDIAAEVAMFVLAVILASAGFAVGRRSGAGLLRSLVGGLLVLSVAWLVVAVKIAIDH